MDNQRARPIVGSVVFAFSVMLLVALTEASPAAPWTFAMKVSAVATAIVATVMLASPKGEAAVWLLSLALWLTLLVLGGGGRPGDAYGSHLLGIGAMVPRAFADWTVFALSAYIAVPVFGNRYATPTRFGLRLTAVTIWSGCALLAAYLAASPWDVGPRPLTGRPFAIAMLVTIGPVPVVLSARWAWRAWRSQRTSMPWPQMRSDTANP